MAGTVTSLSLPHLSERPVRAHHPLHEQEQRVPGGSLLEFLRPRLLSTAVPQSVPAFPPGRASVGCATRGITSVTFAHAGELVSRPGLPPLLR
jgi:hypothetical protein